jgi:hypothetical protein
VLGFEVDFINTVQFSTHTAYKHIKGNVLENDELEQLIEGLALNDVDQFTHMLTGYSRSPESLKQIADIIKKLRQKTPDLVYGKNYNSISSQYLTCYKRILLKSVINACEMRGAVRVVAQLREPKTSVPIFRVGRGVCTVLY